MTTLEQSILTVAERFPSCGECGAQLDHAGEFHPFAFCAMKKRGLDPWAEMRNRDDRLVRRPPRIMGLERTTIEKLMAEAAACEKATR